MLSTRQKAHSMSVKASPTAAAAPVERREQPVAGSAIAHSAMANAIRALAMDAVEQAKSGHPGMPMGMADAAYVLWTQFLRHSPGNPDWPDRDRFVLSAGHGSMLLYSLLHLTGYDLPLEQLKQFRQWGSLTPGHPEYGLTPGVETTTGPLGQGFANGVGMAIAEAFLAATFNRPGHEIVNHYTYAICSDGDLMEGISHEAASMAGHMKLGKLIYLYDDNHISIDGSTDLAYTEDRIKRFEAYHWHTQQIDGHDRTAVAGAIKAAQAVTDMPSIIACRTTIGYGSPNRANTAKAHGEALGVDEVKLTKQAFGWNPDQEFYIPDEALAHFRQAVERGAQWEAEWRDKLEAYAKAYPQEAEQFQRALSGELPEGWEEALPVFPADAKGMATRAASGQVLNAIAPIIPTLIGGSADLAPSNNTMLKGYPVFANDSFAGRNFHFGVREHGMAAALNGMAVHGGVIPYGGTFLIFSDYARPAIRLAALSHFPTIFVFTHDSIGLGEDGPTHQPIEHLAALRAIPNLPVIRPADANETSQAWKVALEKRDGPVLLALTRQNLPVYDRSKMGDAADLAKGAYVLLDAGRVYPDVILIATGSEVQLAVEAHAKLAEQGIAARVVSMPSWELFEKQPDEYRDSVLPPTVKARVAIEAAVPLGWERWVGALGAVIGLNHFGASAPYKAIYQHFGFTTDNVVLRALETIDKSKR
jgi:transketolase